MVLCDGRAGRHGQHLPGVILGAVLLSALPEVLRYTVEPVQQALFGRVLHRSEVICACCCSAWRWS